MSSSVASLSSTQLEELIIYLVHFEIAENVEKLRHNGELMEYSQEISCWITLGEKIKLF